MTRPMKRITAVNDMHSTVEEIKLYFFYHNITVKWKTVIVMLQSGHVYNNTLVNWVKQRC